MIVRLINHGKVIEEREMDRVPIKEEEIIIGDIQEERFLVVKEVFWRQDGHASLLLGEDSL